MAQNRLWRYDDDYIVGYTEDRDVWALIKRNYRFPIMATYHHSIQSKEFARQYLIPIAVVDDIRKLFGAKLER